MAKCLMCNQKKGKRECKIVEGNICSLCCGTHRNDAECIGCEYYKSAHELRKYNKIDKYTPADMEQNFEFQAISDVIEQSFCSVDADENFTMLDSIAKEVLEKLLDRYHFKDEEFAFSSQLVKNCFVYLEHNIKEKLADEDPQTIIKVLGAIYFVLNRRTKGNREYIKVIQKYVGMENGIRVL